MGKALASSKPKKNTEENRRKRKNPKSRKRRRVSSPPSSSLSDTDDRRSYRRKSEIRRGRDRKRSVKKSRKARRRSVSSTSRDSSSSCSTCRGGDDRKGKLKRKIVRGRKLDRVVRSLRSRNRSLSCSTCSGSSGSSQNYSSREVKNKRDGSRQIGSGSVVEEESMMMMKNCDDSQFSHANVGRELGAEIDRWMSESNVENEFCFDQGRWAQAAEPCKELEFDTKLSSRIKSEIVVADKHDSESDDLELMLRQKALENLKKLRSRLSSHNRTTDDKKIELSGIESSEKPSEPATEVVSLPKSPSAVSKELLHIQLGVVSSIDPKVKPAVESPSLEANYSASDKKTIVRFLNQNRQSPCEGSQEKNASEGCGSGNNSLKSEVNLGDGKEKIREVNETVDECQSGSQFEKKTFSRMHDGEMVQVSYKVYIPNKTPALARRKLQR